MEQMKVGMKQLERLCSAVAAIFARADRARRDEAASKCIGATRQSCPHRLRTAVYHWARVAVPHDFHSRNRFSAMRQRGHSHARALRSVGSRLICVACAMLQTGELLDPDRVPRLSRYRLSSAGRGALHQRSAQPTTAARSVP